MGENLINKKMRFKQVNKEIAWIVGEYAKMFPTEPTDLKAIPENYKMYCTALYDYLSDVKEEAKDLGFDPDYVWPELEEKLARVSGLKVGYYKNVTL